MRVDDEALFEAASILTLLDRCLLSLPSRQQVLEIEFPSEDFFAAIEDALLERRQEVGGPTGRARVRPDAAGGSELFDRDFDWAAGMAGRRAVQFVDYSDPSTYASDFRKMESLARQEPVPASTLRVDGPVVALPAPITGFFSSVFSATGSKPFHNHTVLLKRYPSMGARHGLEAFVIAARPSGGSAIACYFDPVKQLFRQQGEIEPLFGEHSYVLLVSCVFERYQWRYRSGWVYYCALFDLGHLLATLDVASCHFGVSTVQLDDEECRRIAPLQDLVNEPLYACALTGFEAPHDAPIGSAPQTTLRQ